MNAVIYARFSSHSQREQSIEGQLSRPAINSPQIMDTLLLTSTLTAPRAAPMITVPSFSE